MNTSEFSSPPLRYLAWSKERFPLINFFSAFLLYALTASCIRHDLPGGVYWRWGDGLYALALGLAFLVLRVLDEHKDFVADASTHPERILQRGIVTLHGLRRLGWVTGTLTLSITLCQGTVAALTSWAVMAIWAWMMSHEFFCAQWLKQRLFLYSVSHMLILPFMIMWAATLATPIAFAAPVMVSLLVLTFVNGLIYEVLRKTKGRDEEIDGVDTFSKRWGPGLAAKIGAVLHLTSIMLFIEFSETTFHVQLTRLLPLVLALILVLGALFNFTRHPEAKQRKANEGASALFVLIAYVSAIVFASIY